MKETTTPKSTPSPSAPADSSKATSRSSGALFLIMALDMTWRLAIVVLVPIVGGFKLDEKFDTSPLLTIIGFVLSLAGTAFVLWQSSQKANQLGNPKKEDK